MLQKTTNLAVLVSIVALALGAAQLLGAQVAGALSGTITDQQGGALGGAKVEVKNVATDVAVQTSTNTVGGTVHLTDLRASRRLKRRRGRSSLR